MSFYEKLIIIMTVVILALYVWAGDSDYNEEQKYIKAQCLSTPQWDKCKGEQK